MVEIGNLIPDSEVSRKILPNKDVMIEETILTTLKELPQTLLGSFLELDFPQISTRKFEWTQEIVIRVPLYMQINEQMILC